MNKFRRNVFRAAYSNIWAYTGAVCIIAVGIFVYVAMMDTLYNLRGQVYEYYEKSRLADIFADVEGISEAELMKLENIEGIEDAYGRISYESRLVSDEFEEIATLHLMGSSESGLNIIRTEDGALPGKDDIYIGSKMMEEYSWDKGEGIELLIGGRARRFNIKGECYAPDYIYSIPTNGSMLPDGAVYDIAYISADVLEEFTGRENKLNEISFLLSDGYSYEDVKNTLSERLHIYGLKYMTDRENQTSYNMVEGEIDELIGLGSAVPLIFMLISVFMLYMVLKKIIDRDRQLIGTMKAMGLRDMELLSSYLYMGFITGVLGALAGSLAAIPFGRLMFDMYADFFNLPDTVYHNYAGSRITGFLIALTVSTAAVYLGVRGISSIQPAESMRPAAPEVGEPPEFTERLLKSLNMFSRMSIRGVFRNPFRSLVLTVAVAFPFAMCSVLFSFDSVIDAMFYDQFEKIQTYDARIVIDGFKDVNEAAASGISIDGVVESEAVIDIAAELKFRNRSAFVNINALHRGSDLYRIMDSRGRFYEPERYGLILNTRTAEELGVKQGDYIEIPSSALGNKSVRIPVCRIIEETFGSGCYMDMEEVSSFFAVEPAANSVLLRAAPGKLDDIKNRVREAGSISSFTDTGRILEIYRDMMKNMMQMINMFIFMAVITGVILIYNISLINIREREREFASLIIMGSSGREIGAMIISEQIVYILSGLLLGFPMAAALKAFLEHIIVSDSYFIHLKVGMIQYCKAFAVCLIIYFFSDIAIMRVIRRIEPSYSLKERG